MKEFGMETIDILKVDIEGSEKEIFSNNLDWIDHVRVICIELHENIMPGSEDAFADATKNYETFERMGEKVIAYARGSD